LVSKDYPDDETLMRLSGDLISQIVEAEWRMHQEVPSSGGRAGCQEDFQTFEIHRSSQFWSWPEACLASYLNDLRLAEKEERNLQTEKYARMMKSTSPVEYALMEHLLPMTDQEALSMIDEISEIVIGWAETLAQKYPYVVGRGRPLRCSEDTGFATSMETYLRSELAVYSLNTLMLYRENVLHQKANNVNGYEITLKETVKRYGFASLEQANERMGAIR
jgi:hypothetical protein